MTLDLFSAIAKQRGDSPALLESVALYFGFRIGDM